MINTTTLETSKALKAAGFRQDKIAFYFVDMGDYRNKGYDGYVPSFRIVDNECAISRKHNTKNNKFPDEQYAAPTTDELLEELPWIVAKNRLNISRGETRIFHVWYGPELSGIVSDSLPEALAAMWLWLKKERLIK